jgi:GT2 family glycosyltransferase
MDNRELDLSIIIVSFDDEKSLSGCLASVYNNDARFEIITIDNNPAPYISKAFKGRFPHARWVENRKNLGFAKAINQGIKKARARYILTLNSDTVLFPDSISNMVSFMDSHKKAGAAGGKILNSRGIVQPTCRRFPGYLTGFFNRTSFLTRLFPDNRFSKRYLLNHWAHENVRRVDWISGAFIIFRREALKDVGYLDEDYFMYCEEVDWCYRAKKKGWKVYYVPQAKLIHDSQHGRGATKKIIYHHRSMNTFYRKHFKKGSVLHYIVALGIFLRAAGKLLLYTLGNPFRALRKTLKVSK